MNNCYSITFVHVEKPQRRILTILQNIKAIFTLVLILVCDILTVEQFSSKRVHYHTDSRQILLCGLFVCLLFPSPRIFFGY